MRFVSALFLSAAMGAALLMSMAGVSKAGGADVFKSKGCAACHYTDGPAKEKTIADQLAKKGPELWYAGSKFRPGWLGAWLADPKPIRPYKYNSLTEKNAGGHPKLSGGDAGQVKDFLMGLTVKGVAAAPPMKDIKKIKGKKIKGKLTFTKKQPCSGCHLYPARKKVTGGFTGPSLVNAVARLNPNWIQAYMENSKAFKPVKDMPNFAGILSKADIRNVTKFIMSFKPKAK